MNPVYDACLAVKTLFVMRPKVGQTTQGQNWILSTWCFRCNNPVHEHTREKYENIIDKEFASRKKNVQSKRL